MPTHEHDAGAELFRESPELAAEVLTEHLHVALPPYASAEVADTDLSLAAPIQATADRVVLLRDGAGAVVFAIVVEIQRKPDAGKRFRWPFYWARAQVQHGCDAALLVIATDDATARWSQALARSCGVERRLHVLGRDALAGNGDVEVWRDRPQLAVLTGLVRHSIEDVDLLVRVEAALDASSIDQRQKSYYWDVILLSADEEVRRLVEQRVMDLTGRYPVSEWGKEWFGRGMQQGRLENARSSLKDVLAGRGWTPSAGDLRSIDSCEDTDLLAEWLRRAVRAASLAEVFGETAREH